MHDYATVKGELESFPPSLDGVTSVRVDVASAFEQSVDNLCGGPLTFIPGLTFDYGDDVYATG